jgi:hypothetical protein
MKIRGIDKRFLVAMRSKLESGRRKGHVGWDSHWIACCSAGWYPKGVGIGTLFDKLMHEVIELALALNAREKSRILEECADVANFAMMIADVHDALDGAAGQGELQPASPNRPQP